MGTVNETRSSPALEAASVRNCALDDPGHRSHWIPPSRTLFGTQPPNAIGRLGATTGWLDIEMEDGHHLALWHHDSGWLVEIFGAGPRPVSCVPGTSFITVAHSGGMMFLYADKRETPCRTQKTPVPATRRVIR